MTRERWLHLSNCEPAERLSDSEKAGGWHWCAEFDGLLVGPGMAELQYCLCWEGDCPPWRLITTGSNAAFSLWMMPEGNAACPVYPEPVISITP